MVNRDVEKRLGASTDQLWTITGLKPSEFCTPVLSLIFRRYAEEKFAKAEKKLGPIGFGKIRNLRAQRSPPLPKRVSGEIDRPDKRTLGGCGVIKVAVLGGMLFVSASPAGALMFCTEPDPPSCIDRSGKFDDEWAFDRCRRQVTQYVADVETYVSCLDQNRAAKVKEANRTVERFNCKAKGGNFCP